MGKIIQNVKFSSISQTSDLISKLDSTRQHESNSMLSFQNRATYIKLLKFHINRDERAYFEKVIYNESSFLRFWECHWICGVAMSLGVCSDSDLESRLTLHKKTRQNLNWQFIVVFKNMTFFFANESKHRHIIYRWKSFFTRVWIQDRYLKIRLCIARIFYQSFAILHGKMCWQSGHFHHEWRVPLQWGYWEELVGTLNRQWLWLEMVMQPWAVRAWPRGLHVQPMLRVDFHEVGFQPNGVFWRSSFGACSTSCSLERDREIAVTWGEKDIMG